jgi:hypothetical protein
MTDFERFAEALALTESDNTEWLWGDSKSTAGSPGPGGFIPPHPIKGSQFRACGRWQMHPDWYAEWADPAIQVGWSWDEAFRAALAKFWKVTQKRRVDPGHAAMIFHLGEAAYQRGDFDEAYMLRFTRFWGQLGA